MIKQVTKDVTDKPICASSVERLPAPSTRIVHTYLQAREGRKGIYREREDIIHQSMSSAKRQLITVVAQRGVWSHLPAYPGPRL